MRHSYTMVYRKLVPDADGGFYYQIERVQENLSLNNLIDRMKGAGKKRQYRDPVRDAQAVIDSKDPADSHFGFFSWPYDTATSSRNGHLLDHAYYVIEVRYRRWRPRSERILSSAEVATLITPQLIEELLRRTPIE